MTPICSTTSDTTSVALSWLFFEIYRHPEIEHKVLTEIMEVLGNNDLVGYEELKQFRYLEMVIKESLRLHPPVYLYARTTTEPTVLGEFTIPTGVEVVIPVYALHRNPRYWENPEVFNPERFTPENSQFRHPFAFLPFSAGSRNW